MTQSTLTLTARLAQLDEQHARLPGLRAQREEHLQERDRLQLFLEALSDKIAETDLNITAAEQAGRTLDRFHLLLDQAYAEAGDPPAPALDSPVPPSPALVEDEAPEPSQDPPADEPAPPVADESAPRFSRDLLVAYLREHPGSGLAELMTHFGESAQRVGSTLGLLSRNKLAGWVKGESGLARWSLTADLPPEAEPAVPVPELPAAEAPAPPEDFSDVSDDDVLRIVQFLRGGGNKTRRQIHAEFRYSHDWSLADVERVVTAGVRRGVLSLVGSGGDRVGVVFQSKAARA